MNKKIRITVTMLFVICFGIVGGIYLGIELGQAKADSTSFKYKVLAVTVTTILTVVVGFVVKLLPDFLSPSINRLLVNNDTDDSSHLSEYDLESHEHLKSIIEEYKQFGPRGVSKTEYIMEDIEFSLANEIRRIRNNSITNLIIGIVGTIVSVAVLVFSLITTRQLSSWEELLIQYLPKLSFVFLAQLFSFFFLRLYKSNQEDLKYFQNELTNLLAKTTAIRLAELHGEKKLLSNIIHDLSKTERNFKLAAGESLLTVEKARLEKEFDLEALSALKAMINNIKTK